MLTSPACCLFFLAIVAALSRLGTPFANDYSERAGRGRFRVGTHSMSTSMACILLPAITNLPLGEYPRYARRRWVFLASKVWLILPSIYAACIYILYQNRSHQPFVIPPQVLLVAIVLAFRWVLNDQRRRCPVPAIARPCRPCRAARARFYRVERHGTDVHARPRITAHSSHACQWSGRQRWFDLDSSWSGLFPQKRCT